MNLAKASSSTVRFIGIHLFGPRFFFFFFFLSCFEADLGLNWHPRCWRFKSPVSKFPSKALVSNVAFVFNDWAVNRAGILQYCSCSLPIKKVRIRMKDRRITALIHSINFLNSTTGVMISAADTYMWLTNNFRWNHAHTTEHNRPWSR